MTEVDEATDGAAAYFMVNCAHPTHFLSVLDDGPWLERVKGVRANSSTKSHAELDEATELDRGDVPASPGTTASSAGSCPTCGWSAAAAAPTTPTWPRSRRS